MLQQRQVESETIVHGLVHRLQTGSVRQKLEAAEQLGSLGKVAVSATAALLAALTDLDMEIYAEGDLTGGGCEYFYVREYAVNALARVNPTAAAPLALQVIAELSLLQKGIWGGIADPVEWNVKFSSETIAAFTQSEISQHKD